MRVFYLLVIEVGLLLICGNSSYADASSPASVLEGIRSADQSMQQGDFSFIKTDSNIRHSTFNSVTEGAMSYDGSGKYRLHYRSGPLGSTPKTVSTEIYDGQYDYLVSGIRTSHPGVVLSATSQMRPVQRILGVFAGPSLIMGRGLSLLNPTTVTQTAKSLTLQAQAPDGTQLIAVLDPGHQYIAKEIVRRDKQGHIIGRWTYGPPIKSKHGPYIASSCSYAAMMSSGAVAITTKTSIKQADFAAPSPHAFDYHLGAAGVAITDMRLGVGETFLPKVDRYISPSDMLQYTKQANALAAQRLAEDLNYRQQGTQKQYALMIIPLLIFATIVAFWRIRFARRQ